MPPIQSKVISKKICYRCREVKPLVDFYPSKARKKYDGRHGQCKICSKATVKEWQKKNYTKMLAKNKSWRNKKKSNGDVRFIILKKLSGTREAAKKYGHAACYNTVEELIPFYSQNCELCNKECGTMIHLDHCHVTGKFRGFICGGCNTVLGHSKEDINILERIIKYIKDNDY